MRLRRFQSCPAAAPEWNSIAGDALYCVEKRAIDAHPLPQRHSGPPILFRIRTRSTPSLVVATAVTLHEILRDWDGLCGNGPTSAAPGPLRAPTRLSSEQVATLVQVGAALTALRYAFRGPVGPGVGSLLLAIAYCKGVLPVAVLLWALSCLLMNRTHVNVLPVIHADHHRSLNVAARFAGYCSSVLEAILAAVTSPNVILCHLPLLLLVALVAQLWVLAQDPAWQPTLRASAPLFLLATVYSVVVWALGELAPHVVPALGWPDPLHLFLHGIPYTPIPRAHASLDWTTAIPISPVDWEAVAAAAASTPAPPPPPQTHPRPPAAETTVDVSAATDAAAGPALPDNLDDILAEVDRLADTGRDATRCVALLDRANDLSPDNAEVLWRYCRSFDEMFMATKDLKKREDLARRGAALGTRATELAPANPAAHRWRGIMLGRSVDFMGIKEKVATGVVVREEFERALELDPVGGYSLFCMASWYLAVAQLSWMERKAATVIFKNFPENPYADGLEIFARAERLISDGNIAVPVQTLLGMAKCCVALKQTDRARQVLKRAVDFPATRPDELQGQAEARQLLSAV